MSQFYDHIKLLKMVVVVYYRSTFESHITRTNIYLAFMKLFIH